MRAFRSGIDALSVNTARRAYASSYSAGYELCNAYVAREVTRYRTLLTTQMTTTDLRR